MRFLLLQQCTWHIGIGWPYCGTCTTQCENVFSKFHICYYGCMGFIATHYHLLPLKLSLLIYTVYTCLQSCVCIHVWYLLPANLPTWPIVCRVHHSFTFLFCSLSLYPPISQWGESATTTRRAQGCKQNLSRKRPKDITTGSRDNCPKMYVPICIQIYKLSSQFQNCVMKHVQFQNRIPACTQFQNYVISNQAISKVKHCQHLIPNFTGKC